MVKFSYDSEKTKQVCRSCGDNHKDFTFIDTSGYCEECGVSTGHLGFTNEKVKFIPISERLNKKKRKKCPKCSCFMSPPNKWNVRECMKFSCGYYVKGK